MREQSLLRNVCKNLEDSLTSHIKITEDQVLAFIEELSVEEPKALQDMPPDYRRLSFSMGEAWQYREWKTLSPEQAFLYGGLWGSSKTYELRYQKKLNADQMETLASKYKSKEWILRAIKAHPGILHKELAAKGNISPSRLSQIMDDQDIDILISYRLSGREKYYFLKPHGEELLKRLKSDERKVLGSYAEPRKAISINNNSTKRVYDEVILFVFGHSGNPIKARTLGIHSRSKGLEKLNSDLGVKNILEVNEWIQGSNYTNTVERSHLRNGLGVSLVR